MELLLVLRPMIKSLFLGYKKSRFVEIVNLIVSLKSESTTRYQVSIMPCSESIQTRIHQSGPANIIIIIATHKQSPHNFFSLLIYLQQLKSTVVDCFTRWRLENCIIIILLGISVKLLLACYLLSTCQRHLSANKSASSR